jgi:hypothetical protein
MMRHPLPKRGPVSTGTSWGERSGAPAGERFPTFPPRGVPGGIVGFATGCRKAEPHNSIRGEEPAGRRDKIAAAGARVERPQFRGVTARHSPGARHPLGSVGNPGAQKRDGPSKSTHPGANPPAGTRGHATNSHPPPGGEVEDRGAKRQRSSGGGLGITVKAPASEGVLLTRATFDLPSSGRLAPIET